MKSAILCKYSYMKSGRFSPLMALKVQFKVQIWHLWLFVHKPSAGFKHNPLAFFSAYNDLFARFYNSFNGLYDLFWHQMTALMSFISPEKIILGVSVLAGL